MRDDVDVAKSEWIASRLEREINSRMIGRSEPLASENSPMRRFPVSRANIRRSILEHVNINLDPNDYGLQVAF